MTPEEDLANRFGFHPTNTDEERRTHDLVRAEAFYVAARFSDLCTPGRELSLAITKLEEATFWANASIARDRAK